jgi:predicted enzyme related to lactoylglutathione lyase
MRTLHAALLLLAGIAGCASVTGIDTSGMSFSDEPLLGKVVWNDLITEDVEAAKHFYSELFGWTFEETPDIAGHAYALARAGNVYVAGLVAADRRADGASVSRWLPYISVADVDDAVTRATAAGGNVAASARNVSLGRVAAILDREGAVIGLARSDIGDPDDRTTAAAPGRVVWTELLANDADAAAEFYRSVVGYDTRTVDRRGGEYTLLGKGGADRAGILPNPSEQAEPRWLTYFGVTDAGAAAERAVALGGTVVLPESPELRDGTMALVTDPSGALLVLREMTP